MIALRSFTFQYLWKLQAIFASHAGVRPLKSVAYQLPSAKIRWFWSTVLMLSVMRTSNDRRGALPDVND